MNGAGLDICVRDENEVTFSFTNTKTNPSSVLQAGFSVANVVVESAVLNGTYGGIGDTIQTFQFWLQASDFQRTNGQPKYICILGVKLQI